MRRMQTLALAAMFLAPAAAFAQDSTKDEDESRSSVVKVDRWTIKPEVNNLTRSMTQFNGLIKSLNSANEDLGEAFKKYLANPDDELLGSEVERKLAAYAANVSKEFDSVIASQDVFTSNFRNLRHKLSQLETRLQAKSGEYKTQLKDFQSKAKDYEKQLIELASKVKDPSLDEATREKLKREFAIVHRRFKMQERYLNGYASRYRGYVKLQQNMAALSDLFGGLNGKFEDLIRNLENEKAYLKASIELQADTLRIKRLIQEGIVGGENAIVNVSEKLATLYVKVDTFNDVHDRISEQMNRFMDSQGALMGVTEKIDAIGSTGIGFGAMDGELDKLIDDFSKRDPMDVDMREPALPELEEKEDK